MILLVSVHCLEKCFFNLNAALKIENTMKYIDKNRDNLIYMNKNSNLTLSYYDHLKNNVDYKINIVRGSASIRIFSGLIYKNVTLNSNSVSRYHTKIINNKVSLISTLIKSFTEDVILDINILYDNHWNRLNIGAKTTCFLINYQSNEFTGYFQMNSNYKSVLLSAKATKLHINTTVTLFVKYFVQEKNGLLKLTNETYPIPDETNSEIAENFDSLLNTVSKIILLI
jgi:hypothetical protein